MALDSPSTLPCNLLMAIDRARTALAQVFFQRCFYLFIALLALMMVAMLLEPTPARTYPINAVNLLIDVAAVAAGEVAPGGRSW